MTDIQILYDGPIVKRTDAKARGDKRYFTGKPCKYGHVAQRTCSKSTCLECKRISSIEYRKTSKTWKAKHKEYKENYKKRYPGRDLELDRLRLKDPIKRETIRDNYKRYYRRNKEKFAVKQSLRRTAVGMHSKEDILEIFDRQNGLCAEPTCRKDLIDGYHVDHIMPIALGGSNWPSNLQCLCPWCNLSKGAKHPDEWAREKGRK